MIGFMSNVMAQAGASYQRIVDGARRARRRRTAATLVADLRGDIARAARRRDVRREGGAEGRLVRGAGRHEDRGHRPDRGRQDAAALSADRTAEARRPGSVEYDGRSIDDYDKTTLHEQVGFVFQDAIIFNLTLRENIAFSKTVTDADLEKAIATAELKDFIDALPDKLDTVVSERGTSLSGGQKQRIMLARALALNPRVLLLDDFTARVDSDDRAQDSRERAAELSRASRCCR